MGRNILLLAVVVGFVVSRVVGIEISGFRLALALVLLVLGAHKTLSGLLLVVKRVQPGDTWGYSVLGSLLLAVGLTLAAIQTFEVIPSRIHNALDLGVVLAIAAGALVEFRARPPGAFSTGSPPDGSH